MTATDQVDENLEQVLTAMDAAADADLLLTPEVSNCVSLSRSHQEQVLEPATQNRFLQAVQARAKARGLWVVLGSIAVKTRDPDGRFANRSFLINDQGKVVAWYDKIHMFDVSLPGGEVYHESKGYRPGRRAVCAQTPWGMLGLSICYDLRFPMLFRHLAQAGAGIITVPSAFAVATGEAHWHALLRARAIETGAYIIAPAQTGTHPGSGRRTYGHSLVVDPWGTVLLDAGVEPGLHCVTLDLSAIDRARAHVPSLSHDKDYKITTACDGDLTD